MQNSIKTRGNICTELALRTCGTLTFKFLHNNY